MRLPAAACAATLLLPPPLAAQAAAGPTAPVLVVHITVDQMRGDYLERWRNEWTGGLARLVREGAWFSDAHQDHALAETAPGHASLLSGRNPRGTGIIRNTGGVEDPGETIVGWGDPGASPLRFRGTALFDWMAARWPDARALSVSRKDRGAILPLGRARQDVYWWHRGAFTTSTYYADSLPGWVRRFNAEELPRFQSRTTWTLLLPETAYAEPDDQPWEGDGAPVTFPHTRPESVAVTVRSFGVSPWMDEALLAFALAGVERLGLGRGPHPDLLAVSLSATDNIGHAFGPDSREIHDQLLRLDRVLGSFLDSLGRLRDPARIIVSLSADHGVTPLPEYARAHGVPDAQRVDLDTLWERVGQDLAGRVTTGRWFHFFDLGLLVLDRRGLAARRVDVDSLVAAVRAAILRHPGVERVDTRRSLARADTVRDAVARRWIHAVPADLGGELFVTLRPSCVWGSRRIAEHGVPLDADTHVPIILWGAPFRAGVHTGRVSITDIAPTLAHVLGVRPAERLEGRVLREALR